jgi:hypothetical protein
MPKTCWDVLGARAGRGTWARSTFKNERQKEYDMATYPVEFHRRLEQKWESRIEQILSVTGTVPPPRRPNDDYDDDEDADQEDGEQSDEPAVVREPEED